jgi:hypothetical protein
LKEEIILHDKKLLEVKTESDINEKRKKDFQDLCESKDPDLELRLMLLKDRFRYVHLSTPTIKQTDK